MKSQYSDLAKFSLPSLHGRPSLSIRISWTELFASVQQLAIKSSAIVSSIGIILCSQTMVID